LAENETKAEARMLNNLDNLTAPASAGAVLSIALFTFLRFCDIICVMDRLERNGGNDHGKTNKRDRGDSA